MAAANKHTVKRAVYSLIFVVSFLCRSYGVHAESLLTPLRPREIRFLFTHFTPFEDMNYPSSRAQRMGFRRSSLPQSESNFSFWENMSADLRGIIEAYVAQARAVRKGRKISTFHEFLTKMVHGPRHDEDLFLYHLLNNATTTIFFRNKVYYEFLRGFLDEYILPARSAVYREPLFMSVMKAWKIIHLLQISSSHVWFGKPSGTHTLVAGTLSKIHDEWSVMFIGHFCHAIRENKLQTPTGFCPDPCLAQPCSGITGTSSSKCTPFGFSPREYDCVCQPQHQWVRPSRERPEGACVAKSRWELYCDEKGTQRRDYVEGKEICVCRESHMGPRCEKLRDPCIDTSDPRMLAGNAACNSPEGGMCFGYLGSNAYKCNCSNGYMSDAAYPHSNCLRLRDSCLSRVCVYGDCISSKDGQVGLSVCTSTGKVVDSYLQQKDAFAYQWDAFLLNQWMYRSESHCLCAEEAYGEFCDKLRGKWSLWTPWSVCTPNCGISNYRRRSRTRDCLGLACRGGDGHIQVQPCETMPCPDQLLLLASEGRSGQTGDLKTELLQADVARMVKLVGAVAKVFLLISCLLTMVIATALVLSDVEPLCKWVSPDWVVVTSCSSHFDSVNKRLEKEIPWTGCPRFKIAVRTRKCLTLRSFSVEAVSVTGPFKTRPDGLFQTGDSTL
ncbi:hypothetical protein X801_05896 [Opisthorchis viverrini]|uniref:EGF-like domain-containing protein n=1 Tax=Opisthorchis viverrini TaxID=6198 RepID=A0A1S8WVI7_OPIVI|nr:hypothetical protein X801_05896 [Opisthorchis viverrini]